MQEAEGVSGMRVSSYTKDKVLNAASLSRSRATRGCSGRRTQAAGLINGLRPHLLKHSPSLSCVCFHPSVWRSKCFFVAEFFSPATRLLFRNNGYCCYQIFFPGMKAAASEVASDFSWTRMDRLNSTSSGLLKLFLSKNHPDIFTNHWLKWSF